MAFAELWLPVFGAGILIAWAIAAWYAGNKIHAIWLTFGGVVCLLLLATLQWQHADEKAETPTRADEPKPTNDINRPWLGIDVEIAGPLLFENGIGIPLKITMTNSAVTPAIGALPHPMIFTNEKQPFFADEIIKRRSAVFGTGGGLGHSVFLNKPVIEINTPSNIPDEFKGQNSIAPFILVAVKYRAPNSDKIYLTANLY